MPTVQEIRKSLFDKVFPDHPKIAEALTKATASFYTERFGAVYKFATADRLALIELYEQGKSIEDAEVQVVTMNGVPVRNTAALSIAEKTTEILKAKYGKQ